MTTQGAQHTPAAGGGTAPHGRTPPGARPLHAPHYGLASPLRDRARFRHDDPLLYLNLHVSSGLDRQHTLAGDTALAAFARPPPPPLLLLLLLPPPWAVPSWSMPGGFELPPADAMDVDPPRSVDPAATLAHTGAPFALLPPGAASNPAGFGHHQAPGRDPALAGMWGGHSMAPASGYTPHADADSFFSAAAAYPQPDLGAFGNTPHEHYADDSFRDSFHGSFHGTNTSNAADMMDSGAAHLGAFHETPFSDPHFHETPLQSDPGAYQDIPEFADFADFAELDSAPAKGSASLRTSILAAVNELLPLTTTTSFTPSATSLHLTQHSFFSAQQFWPSTTEQGRVSTDLYLRRRLSGDSAASGPHVSARSQRLLASYFHFRDREGKLPMPRGDSPEWPPVALPRHSIRSIFKTGGPGEYDAYAEASESEHPEHLEPHGSNTDGGLAELDALAQKKRRSKRHLFTRFKLVRQDPEDHRLGSDSEPAKELVLVNSGTAEQPDYAALFSGVGKRRALVMKKKKDMGKTDTKLDLVKVESDDPAAEYSGDCALARSAALSQNSFTSKDSAGESAPLAFANALKRILGLRLLKKKNSHSKIEAPSDVVEVELQLLDLPESTEILLKPRLVSKTRGRKQDREADMVDVSKIFVCGYCDRRFKRQEHLKRHFRSLHTTEKPYDCPICLKKFSRTDNLNQHLKIHKQEEEEAAAAACRAEAMDTK